jgi:transcriptional regulator with XRE-family HTH domain
MDDSKLFSALLKYWRGARGMSQLDLALAADVSARHVSFLESGRARPSEGMLLRLMATLGLPLRDQNAMLRAASFAPRFAEPALDAVDPSIDFALARMLAFPDIPPAWRQPDFSEASAPAFSLALERAPLRLQFFMVVTAFAAPQQVTLDELRLESYFPADAATQEACERLAEITPDLIAN